MPIKIVLSDFGINTKDVPLDVKEKLKSLSQHSKLKLEKSYGSVENFLIVLYHLWFIEKLEKSEIANKLHVRPVNVHTQLYTFSWFHSNDYQKNKAFFEQDLQNTKNDILDAKKKSKLLDANDKKYIKLKQVLSNAEGIHEKTYQSVGFQTADEYARTLYYLICEKQPPLAPIKLIPLFNLGYTTIEQRLRFLGLNVSPEEGIANKKERGSQDYGASIRSGKKTTAKSQLKKFSKGSILEDYVRAQLANYIYDSSYLDNKKYEVVIGTNNTGILGALEIDIPVMVYSIETKELHRFVIEFSGEYFHTTKRDENKKSLAESKGWHYLEIRQKSGDGYSNKPELLNPIVHELCKKITAIVELKLSQ